MRITITPLMRELAEEMRRHQTEARARGRTDEQRRYAARRRDYFAIRLGLLTAYQIADADADEMATEYAWETSR